MNSSFDERGQYAWDSTSLKLAQTCLRKYQYKMIEGWQPLTKSVHLDFGGWYASALERYHKLRAEGTGREDAIAEIVHKTLIDTWVYETVPSEEGDEGFPDSVIIKRDDEGNRIGKPWAPPITSTGSAANKTRENLVRTIVWYFEQFEEEATTTVILADGRAAVEYSYSLPVDDGIVFSGHIDRLVEYSGDKYVMDQKTTGSTISARFFADFDLDIQMSMYTFAGKMIYNLPVKGVIIDGAQIAVGFTRFERGFTFRSEGQLNEWYDEMMGLIAGARYAFQQQSFPRNLTACNNYGGCEFRNVCSKPKEHRNAFLRGDFEQGPTWDPLKKR